MKAFLLIAGKGERLRPLTYETPKCLLPIKDRPLLAYWFDLFNRYNIKEVLINLHHLPEKVTAFIRSRRDNGIKVTEFYEKELLGTAGTVSANRAFVEGEKTFFIFYGDNLTNTNLDKMALFHKKKKSFFTMGLFKTGNPSRGGVAVLDSDSRIVEFEEKPKSPKNDLINGGIFLATNEIFKYMPERKIMDFGFDVLPDMTGKMYGYVIPEYLIDIGTPSSYKQACAEWQFQ